MKKFVCIILPVILAATITSACAYYNDYDDYGYDDYDSDDDYGYGSGSVYCRSGSNIRSSHWLIRGDNVIGYLPDGATAEYLGRTWIDVDSNNRPWYYIRYNGIVGWVSGKYTELNRYGSYDDDAGNGYYIYD